MSGLPPEPTTVKPLAGPAAGLDVASARRLLEEVLEAPTPVPCGAKWVPPTVDELAPFFPKYRILNLIGRGGMGAVYLALDPELHRQVAIKCLPPHLAERPGYQERFRLEALALARLDHQNVVRIHEYGPRNAPLSFVMDYVVGQNLAGLLRQQCAARAEGGPPVLSFSEIIALVAQICAGVQVAHEQGIVHRDIKPANIMVTPRGTVKVADFGLALEITPQQNDAYPNREYEVMGTVEYMAPEVLRGGVPTPQSDVFSVGVVLYEMLTGEVPTGACPPPSSKAPLHPRVDALVLKAVHPDAARRFPDAASMALALQRLHPSDGKRHRWHRPIVLGIVLALGGMAAALVAWSRPSQLQHFVPPKAASTGTRLPLADGLFYEECFDYPAGTRNLPGHGGFAGKVSRGAASDIVPGSLSYEDAAGNRLATSGNSVQALGRPGYPQIDDVTALNLPADTPEVIWCSLLAQQTAGTTARFFNLCLRAKDNTLQPPDYGASDDEIVAIGMPSAAPFQYWQMWDRTATGVGRHTAVSGISTTAVAFLVVRLELNVNAEGCERFTLWVNPRLDATPAGTAISFTSAFSNLNRWSDLCRLRIGVGVSDQPGLSSGFRLDEIRLGTTAAAVMPMVAKKR